MYTNVCTYVCINVFIYKYIHIYRNICVNVQMLFIYTNTDKQYINTAYIYILFIIILITINVYKGIRDGVRGTLYTVCIYYLLSI